MAAYAQRGQMGLYDNLLPKRPRLGPPLAVGARGSAFGASPPCGEGWSGRRQRLPSAQTTPIISRTLAKMVVDGFPEIKESP